MRILFYIDAIYFLGCWMYYAQCLLYIMELTTEHISGVGGIPHQCLPYYLKPSPHSNAVCSCSTLPTDTNGR